MNFVLYPVSRWLPTALGAFLSLTGAGFLEAADTIQDFTGGGGQSSYAFVKWGATGGSNGAVDPTEGDAILADGTTDDTQTLLVFDRTATGTYGRIDATWTVRTESGRHGFCFALLDTIAYGTSGGAPFSSLGSPPTDFEEPAFTNSLAIGFDTHSPAAGTTNAGDFYGRGEHDISIHWNGVTRENKRSPINFKTNGTYTINAIVDFVVGGAEITVTVDGNTVYDAIFVPSPVTDSVTAATDTLDAYEARVAFGARTGTGTGTAGLFAIDDISVVYSEAGENFESPTVVNVWTDEFISGGSNQREDDVIALPAPDRIFERIVLKLHLEQPTAGWDGFDRIGNIFLLKADGNKLGIARFITPFPLTGGNYEFYFDVTDFQSLLKGDVPMRLFIDAQGSKGYQATVKVHYYPGEPEYVATRVHLLFESETGAENAGGASDRSSYFVNQTVPLSANADQVKLWWAITGHSVGGSGPFEFTGSGAPFDIDHTATVNGVDYVRVIGNRECYLNPVTPQGGTMVYDRAGGWCPGQEVHPTIIDVTGDVSPGTPFVFGYDIDTTASGGGFACSMHIIEYEKVVKELPVSETFEGEAIGTELGAATIWSKRESGSSATVLATTYATTGSNFTEPVSGAHAKDAAINGEMSIWMPYEDNAETWFDAIVVPEFRSSDPTVDNDALLVVYFNASGHPVIGHGNDPADGSVKWTPCSDIALGPTEGARLTIQGVKDQGGSGLFKARVWINGQPCHIGGDSWIPTLRDSFDNFSKVSFEGAGDTRVDDVVIKTQKAFEVYHVVVPPSAFGGSGNTPALPYQSGADIDVTLTPEEYYAIDEVLVNGSPIVPSGNTITLSNISEDSTVVANFVAERVGSLTPKWWLNENSLSTDASGAASNLDGDALTAEEEYILGLDPDLADSFGLTIDGSVYPPVVSHPVRTVDPRDAQEGMERVHDLKSTTDLSVAFSGISGETGLTSATDTTNTYLTDPGTNPVEFFQVDVTLTNSGSSAPQTGVVDLSAAVFTSYESGQDLSGGVVVSNGDISVTGNTWKKTDFVYTVTKNTVIEFDLDVMDEGELIAIGLDDDNDVNNLVNMVVVGGNEGAFPPSFLGEHDSVHAGPPDPLQHFVIPIGQYFTGLANYLTIAGDDDFDASIDFTISNLRVYDVN